MKSVLNTLKKLAQKARDFFPSKLPQGMTEFNAYVDSILRTYSLPATDNDIRYTVAAMIINGGKTTASVSKRSIILAIRAAIAKQVAGAAFQEIQLAHQAKLKAEREAAMIQQKPAEATALHVVPSDGQK